MTNDSVTKTWVGGIVNKTSGKNNFDSIMNMLKNPRCKITTISYSSLKGFIFKLHISKKKFESLLPESEIEFYGVNESKTAFDSPIDTLIIKLAILHEHRELKIDRYFPYSGLEKKVVNKETDTVDNFKQEAVTQSMIYQKTSGKGEPICPALVDFSYFPDYLAGKEFLSLMAKRCVDSESLNMIKYLKLEILNADYQLGMITMESAYEFETVSDMKKNSLIFEDEEMEEQIQNCYNYIIMNLIRMFNETRFVHCDFHDGNCLIKENPDGSYKIYIIDFGRVLNIDDLTEEEKDITQDYAEDKYNCELRERNRFSWKELFIRHHGGLTLHSIYNTNLVEFTTETYNAFITLIACLEYMYNKLKFNLMCSSNIYDYYLMTLRNDAKVDTILQLLNDYYKNQGVYIQRFDNYNVLKSDANYSRTIKDIHTESKAQVDHRAPLIKRQKTVPSDQEEQFRKTFKKQRRQGDGENHETTVLIKTPMIEDSENAMPHSYPNTVSSLSELNVKRPRLQGGNPRKSRRRTIRRKSRRTSRKR